MAPFAPSIRDVRTLQYWWLGFAGLLLIGGLVVFFRSYDQAGSVQQALHHYTPFQRQVRFQFLVFLLLLVVSTTAQKAVWWLAVGIIVLKAGLLVAYYLTTTIAVQSKMYYEELLYCCTVLHLRYVPGIFFSEPFSLALLGLYAYWLVVCRRILRTKE
jgi:hypothetical protein